MADLFPRALLPFPPGDNSTDTIINGNHFNLTALHHFNYTLYSNNTLSNASKCFLAFDMYGPVMFSNGTFMNGTSCYEPFYSIRQRGILGVAFACAFMISIMFTAINLRKHGRLFLPTQKRFRAVGRRWQWYWLFFVAACGTISGFTSIDVDRYYLQSLPIILTNLFYFLMIPGILAAVWESVRHWGSWQERQICDHDSFSLRQDDPRARREFWMPLIFYLFGFMNFFMTIPRSWTKIQYQHSPEQQSSKAKPVATDGRFKAAAIFAFLAWLVTVYSLWHSIRHYKPRSSSLIGRLFSIIRYSPAKFLILLPLALLVVGYDLTIAFEWTISPIRSDGNPAWFYGLGYGPILIIIIVFEIWGYIDKNEDRILIAQRRQRGREIDEELGIIRGSQKPTWWRRLHGNKPAGGGDWGSPDERLKNLINSEFVGGGRVTHERIEEGLALGHIPVRGGGSRGGGEEEGREGRRKQEDDPFLDDPAAEDEESRQRGGGEGGGGSGGRRESRSTTDTTNSDHSSQFPSSRQPIQVKSMLDV
ncbi:MAG: hypothetical protein M1823_003313 [Watsoniomyces obsoletus]|nr:MAG: hypothetical protein M1823_003313 [Watsoniomyces obsoletus]